LTFVFPLALGLALGLALELALFEVSNLLYVTVTSSPGVKFAPSNSTTVCRFPDVGERDNVGEGPAGVTVKTAVPEMRADPSVAVMVAAPVATPVARP